METKRPTDASVDQYSADHRGFVEALQSIGTFTLPMDCSNYVYASVPDALATHMQRAIREHFGEAMLMKTPAHWHVTIMFPKMQSDGPNASLQHFCTAMDVPCQQANNKDDRCVNDCMQTIKSCFPSIIARFGDLCVVTDDKELAAIEVLVDSIGFPHEPNKKYHITLWFNRDVQGRQPFCSNLFLMNATRKQSCATE